MICQFLNPKRSPIPVSRSSRLHARQKRNPFPYFKERDSFSVFRFPFSVFRFPFSATPSPSTPSPSGSSRLRARQKRNPFPYFKEKDSFSVFRFPFSVFRFWWSDQFSIVARETILREGCIFRFPFSVFRFPFSVFGGASRVKEPLTGILLGFRVLGIRVQGLEFRAGIGGFGWY